MMNADQQTIYDEIANGIAWVGGNLVGYLQLGDDLEFRAALAAAFCNSEKPFPNFRINGLLQHERFTVLLSLAIQSVVFDAYSWYQTIDQSAAPLSLGGNTGIWVDVSKLSARPVPPRLIEVNRDLVWKLRARVFSHLMQDSSFRQVVLEKEHALDWISRITRLWRWERKPSGAAPAASVAGVTPAGLRPIGLFNEMSGPLLKGLLYVAPVVVGGNFLISHYYQIEQRLEVERFDREREFVERQSDIERNTREVLGGNEPHIGEIAVRTDAIANAVASISNDVNLVQDQVSEVRASIGNIRVQVPPIVLPDTMNLRVSGTNGPIQMTAGVTQMGAIDIKAPSEGLTVRLGNASGSEIATGAGDGLRLLQISEQRQYTTPSTAPVPPVGNFRVPYVVAFDGKRAQKLGDLSPSVPEWADFRLAPCKQSKPYEFVLMQGSASSCSEGIILTLTETPQYVDKLHAYVRMDIASKRKYWLFGDRRLVLSIAPALN